MASKSNWAVGARSLPFSSLPLYPKTRNCYVFNIFSFSPLLPQSPNQTITSLRGCSDGFFLEAHAHDRSEYTPGGEQIVKNIARYGGLSVLQQPFRTFYIPFLIRKMQIKLLILKASQKDVQSSILRTRNYGHVYFFPQKKRLFRE